MAMKKNLAIAEGRSFNTGVTYDGAMKIVKDFLVTTVGWHLLYDDSANPTNPYITISNKAVTTQNDPDQIYIKLGFDVSSSGNIRQKVYMGFDGIDTTSLEWSSESLPSYDDAEFELHIRSETDLSFICITTKTGANIDTWCFDANDISKSLFEDKTTRHSITAYTRLGDIDRADITLNSTAGVTVGNEYFIVDTVTGNYKRVVVEDINALVVTVVVGYADFDSMPASMTAGSIFGTLPYKFYTYRDGSIRLPLIVGYYGDGFLGTHVNANTRGVANLLGYTSPKVVINRTMHIDGTTSSPNRAERTYGGMTKILYGTGFGSPLTTGITVGAVNYVMVAQDWFVEDGVV